MNVPFSILLLSKCSMWVGKCIYISYSKQIDIIDLLNNLSLSLSQSCLYVSIVPTKVKKTDLPVMPPESEILPSLDDAEDNFSDDLDDDDDLDDQDEMVVDEPPETLEEEEDEDDYESDEDSPSLDPEFSNDGMLSTEFY